MIALAHAAANSSGNQALPDRVVVTICILRAAKIAIAPRAISFAAFGAVVRAIRSAATVNMRIADLLLAIRY